MRYFKGWKVGFSWNPESNWWERGMFLAIVAFCVWLCVTHQPVKAWGSDVALDTDKWTPVILPESVWLCRPDSLAVEGVRCWPVPAGSVLLIPVPGEDRPLPKDDYNAPVKGRF